jgi:hypothetical protein
MISDLSADMEGCSRISIIDKRLITFLLQGNYVVFLILNL